MHGSREHPATHTWISTRLVLETLLIFLALAAASAAAYELTGWPRLLVAPPLLLALGLWFDRMFNVGHEAVHRKLFPGRPRLNDLLGALMFAPLLAPFTVVRKIHGFHHAHNRRAPGVATLDVVLLPPGPAWRRHLARARARLVWLLAVFAGGFFLHALVSVLLFLLLPTRLARRVSPAFRGWQPRHRLRAWLELAPGVAMHLLVWRLGGRELWLATLGLPLLVFAWVWSLMLYIYHYDTTLGGEVRGNVRSLRPGHRVLSWVMLNFSEHATHHADPGIPWYLLPALRVAPSRPENQRVDTLGAAILQQLRGPTFVERPPAP